MRIIENPNKKLESVDLIDDNGGLLRITAESLIEIRCSCNGATSVIKDTMSFMSFYNPPPTLSFKVLFLNHTLDFHFVGDKAVKIAEALRKLNEH